MGLLILNSALDNWFVFVARVVTRTCCEVGAQLLHASAQYKDITTIQAWNINLVLGIEKILRSSPDVVPNGFAQTLSRSICVLRTFPTLYATDGHRNDSCRF
jgi:hypothetical protein